MPLDCQHANAIKAASLDQKITEMKVAVNFVSITISIHLCNILKTVLDIGKASIS